MSSPQVVLDTMELDHSTSGGDAPDGGVRPVGNRDTMELDPQADLSGPRWMTVPTSCQVDSLVGRRFGCCDSGPSPAEAEMVNN